MGSRESWISAIETIVHEEERAGVFLRREAEPSEHEQADSVSVKTQNVISISPPEIGQGKNGGDLVVTLRVADLRAIVRTPTIRSFRAIEIKEIQKSTGDGRFEKIVDNETEDIMSIVKRKPMTISGLLDSLSGWRRKRLVENLFGRCPECRLPKNPLLEKRDYSVLTVDTYSWAICDLHKVRWCLGFLQLGPRYLDAEATEALRKESTSYDYSKRVLNPAYLAADQETRATARLLLTYRDVSTEISELKSSSAMGEADIAANGLEARAEGIINYLHFESALYLTRTEDGRLVCAEPEA
jgi:hypothetical protein